MTLLTTIKKAHGNLWRTKFRSLLTILSVFIGALALSLIISAGAGFQGWIDDQIGNTKTEGFMFVVPEGANSPVISPGAKEYKEGMEDGFFNFSSFKQEDIERLEDIENVKRVEKDLSDKITLRYTQKDDSKKAFSGLKTLYPNMELSYYAGENPEEGESGEVALSYELATIMGYEEPKDLIGKTVTMNFKDDLGETFEREYTVSGILKNSLLFNDRNYLPEAEVQEVYQVTIDEVVQSRQVDENVTTLDLLYDPNLSEEEVNKIKEDVKDAGYDITTPESIADQFTGILTGLQFGLGVFATIALVTAFFGVINTLVTSTLERTKEIGLMRALGESKGGIFRLFAIEAGLIGFWGSVIGLLTSTIIAVVVNNIVAQQKLFGFEDGNMLIINGLNVVLVVGVITLVTLIAGILPAVKAANTDPVNSLKYE